MKRILLPLILAMVLIGAIAACSDSTSETTPDAPTTEDATTEGSADDTTGDVAPSADGALPVVIDSDGAFDDMKAIMFLLERPEVDVLAITMSGTGVAHCPDAAENVAAVLERVGAPEIPVSCGRTTPLKGDNEAPALWRSAADGLGGVALPASPTLSELSSPELFAETIAQSDEAVIVVALGPLTNVAEALANDPAALDNVQTMYLMGGAVDDGGNMMGENPEAEFNIWADPYAAARVFDSDVSITLVPLDATNELPVTPYLYEAVAAHRSFSPVSELLAEYLDGVPFLGGLYHWDELASVVAIDPSVVTFEDRTLSVVEDGGPRAGATVDDPSGRPVRVAVDADRDRFEAMFYETLIGVADPGVDPWEPDATVTWDGSVCTYDGPATLPDRGLVQINNLTPDLMALLTGTYDPGTDADDWEQYRTSSNDLPPTWWSQQTTLPVPGGAHDIWAVTGGPDVTALCFVDAAHLWELAGPTLADAATAEPVEVQRFDATVGFDGEACVYDGPTELPNGAEVTFQFETASDDVTLIVIGVHDGTTWSEVASFTADFPASTVPPFIDYVRMETQVGAGSMTMALSPGEYLVTCNTSTATTDRAHPAVLLVVGD